MIRLSPSSRRAKAGCSLAVVLFLTVSLFVATGASCGVPFSSATFRDAALSEISTGVKSIVNGILDGIFAVLEDAGDGGSSTSG